MTSDDFACLSSIPIGDSDPFAPVPSNDGSGWVIKRTIIVKLANSIEIHGKFIIIELSRNFTWVE